MGIMTLTMTSEITLLSCDMYIDRIIMAMVLNSWETKFTCPQRRLTYLDVQSFDYELT